MTEATAMKTQAVHPDMPTKIVTGVLVLILGGLGSLVWYQVSTTQGKQAELSREVVDQRESAAYERGRVDALKARVGTVEAEVSENRRALDQLNANLAGIRAALEQLTKIIDRQEARRE